MNLHLIIGEDDYLVGEAAKNVIGTGVGLEVIDSNGSGSAEPQLRDLRAADESFMTPPFFDPEKTTWWKNVGFLPQRGKGAPSAEVKEALLKFAKKLAVSPLPGNQRFILSGPRLDMTSEFAKTLKGAAEVIEYRTGKPWERRKTAVVRVLDLAAELGLKFAVGAADAFVERVGTDSRSLMNELEKMREYLGGDANEITAADIAAVSSPGAGVEPEVFAITDAVGARDLAKTLEAVRPFELENGFAILVTTVVERLFRELAELKDAAERGLAEAAAEGMNPYQARKLTGLLRKWTLRELRVARARFVRLRELAVSSSDGVDALVISELVRTVKGNVRK